MSAEKKEAKSLSPFEIKQRPDRPDFHWFVCDLMRTAKHCGYQLQCTFEAEYEQCYHNDRAKWVRERVGKYYIECDQLQRDWSAYLRREKTLEDVSHAQHCYDNLLLPSAGLPTKTETNADALSRALEEELPKERNRYLGLIRSQQQETRCYLESHNEVSQVMAATYLDCSDRWIRELVKRRNLRKTVSGKITSESILAYKKTLSR